MKKIISLIINYIVTFLMFFYVGCSRNKVPQEKIVRKVRVNKIWEKKNYYDIVLNYRNDTIFKSFVFYTDSTYNTHKNINSQLKFYDIIYDDKIMLEGTLELSFNEQDSVWYSYYENKTEVVVELDTIIKDFSHGNINVKKCFVFLVRSYPNINAPFHDFNLYYDFNNKMVIRKEFLNYKEEVIGYDSTIKIIPRK